MGQDFMGSNNMALLAADGCFGTRLSNGADHASPRYIHTFATPFANVVFNKLDDPVLERRVEEGVQVEQVTMAPVMPIQLVNGVRAAIGTGFSSDVPARNPLEVLANVERYVASDSDAFDDFKPMAPWFNGFRGVVREAGEGKWVVEGVYSVSGNVITVTEAPPRSLTAMADFYKSDKSPFVLVEDRSTEVAPLFKLRFKDDKSREAVEKKGLAASLLLVSHESEGNMHMFSPEGVIKRYANTKEILSDFCVWRLGIYVKRRAHMLEEMRKKVARLTDTHRFICAVVRREIDIAGGDEAALVRVLVEGGYAKVDSSYEYLLSIPIRSLTKDRAAAALAAMEKERAAEAALRAKTARMLWADDLAAVRAVIAAAAPK